MNNLAISRRDSTTARQLSVKRLAYQFAGHLLFGLGVVGIMLPVLPTTVFWIGAAACYLKSSPENYRALIARKHYGKIITNYLEHGVIGNTEKRVAIVGMLVSSVVLLFLPMESIVKLLGVLGIALGALYVLTRPATGPE